MDTAKKSAAKKRPSRSTAAAVKTAVAAALAKHEAETIVTLYRNGAPYYSATLAKIRDNAAAEGRAGLCISIP